VSIPILTTSVLAFAVVSELAFAQAPAGNSAEGERLAKLWCASCHLVGPGGTVATTEAPPFESIAERSTDDLGWLRAFLMDPHPPMPQFSLSRDEIRNLAAYIASLKDSR
jgi:mono/diheme cytochrome c family protein